MTKLKAVELYENYADYIDKEVILSGWVIRKRNAKGGTLVFVDFSDG